MNLVETFQDRELGARKTIVERNHARLLALMISGAVHAIH